MMRRCDALALGLGFVFATACGPASTPAASAEAIEVDVRVVEPVGENAGEQWPQWRGPSRQNHVEGEGYPDRWSDDHNVAWRAEVPGRGHSSPVVWEDRIFITTAYDAFYQEGVSTERILEKRNDQVFLDADREHARSLLCFDRESGELLWETFVPYTTTPETGWPKSSYASSTPATDGERVYVYLGNHGLMAVDFEGEVLWHDDLGDISQVNRGSACSPLLFEDKVILFQDNRGPAGSFIAAFDRETGEQQWRTERSESVGWSSPLAIHVQGDGIDRYEIITSSQRYVRAYDPHTGEELWHSSGNLGEVTPSPAVGHGMIFASSGRQGPTLAIRPGGSGDVTDSHRVWDDQRGAPFIPSPLLHDGYLYTLNDMSGILHCYEAETGELMYRARLSEQIGGEGISSSPLAVDDKIFITTDDGRTFVVRAGPEYELLHVNELEGYVFATPAVVDGRWYIRTDTELLCIAGD